MSQISSALDLRFGVELELVVKSRSYNHKSFESLASEISSSLLAVKILNHVSDLFKKEDEKYEEWSIVDELSIISRHTESRCEPTTGLNF